MTWLRRLAERTIGPGASAAPAVRPYVPPRFAPDAPLGAARPPDEIEIAAPAPLAISARGLEPGPALLVPRHPAPLATFAPDPGRGGAQPMGQRPDAEDRLDGRDSASGARALDYLAILEATRAPTGLVAAAPDNDPAAGRPVVDGAGRAAAPVASADPAAALWAEADPDRATERAARDRASADRAAVDVDHGGQPEAAGVEPHTRARRDEASADELVAIARNAADAAIARAGLAPRGRRDGDAQLGAARQRHAGAAAEPAIHVTIGRVDVRAVLPGAAPRPAAPQQPRAAISLDEYLRQRNRGDR
jgi:hypothetical protein